MFQMDLAICVPLIVWHAISQAMEPRLVLHVDLATMLIIKALAQDADFSVLTAVMERLVINACIVICIIMLPCQDA